MTQPPRTRLIFARGAGKFANRMMSFAHLVAFSAEEYVDGLFEEKW